MNPEPTPGKVAELDGGALWFLNSLCVIKATTETTNGAFAMVHQTAPPGHATPYHLHYAEDEAFYVLDGEYTFICAGKRTTISAGGYIYLPRGIPHGIRVTSSTPATMLILATPGDGFIGMMREMALPALGRTLPAPTDPDRNKLLEVCAKYHIEILGPLPA